MNNYILIHYGEISLKGKNQPHFRMQLLKNIRLSLKSADIDWPIKHQRGYLSLAVLQKEKTKIAQKKIEQVFGITWFSPALRYQYQGFDPDSVTGIVHTIEKQLCQLANERYMPGATFSVQVRRSDKRFPVTSLDLERLFGSSIIKNTSWENVNLKKPDQVYYVEIQSNEVFIHTDKFKGMGGLPVNTAHRVLVMFSGGIDSPVAAYLAARRGCHIDYVHFTASHVQPEEIINSKIGSLVEKLSEYTLKSKLYVFPSTYFDLAITGKRATFELVLFRRFMAKTAQKLADQQQMPALVTGDNLSQVASQTLSNIASTTRAVEIPVLQPVLTFDKEEIIQLAKRIDTYNLSLQPYKDCCSLFQRHPRTVSNHDELSALEFDIFENYEKMIDQTFDDMFWIEYRYGRKKG
jgi:thiamine biosynthesis protein ThiI